MKRNLFALLLLLTSMVVANANPTYLVNVSSPSESNGYKGYPYKNSSSPKIKLGGGFSWYGGFRLRDNSNGAAYATFPLKEGYSKLMFVIAPVDIYREIDQHRSEEPSIITVTASGRKVFDHIIRSEEVPQRFTIDIEGATELEFKIVRSTFPIGIAEATLWKKGETPYATGNPRPKSAQPITLMKELKPYYTKNVTLVGPNQQVQTFNHAGVDYNTALNFNMVMPMIGRTEGWAHFYTRGLYSKATFISAMTKGKGSGWLTIKADGKIIHEIHLESGEIPEQMTLDIGNCEMLSFCSENETGDTKGGFMDIRLYPEGVEPDISLVRSEASADPRLKALPDVCKLMSNIEPYYKVSSVQKQIYNGESDYVTFSMGGQKFSEGVVLYKTGSFFDDDVSSVATFDLGREFDYVRFTTGYIGKSGKMNNDVLRVWADDDIVFEHPLIASYPNETFTVPIKKCRRLRFANLGSGNLSVAAFGVGDIILFRGEPVETDLFARPSPYCPDEIDLLDLGLPYVHYVSSMKTILHDGSTRRNYFQVGDKQINKGFVLKTSTHFSFDFGIIASGGNLEEYFGDTIGTNYGGLEYDPVAEKRKEEARKRKEKQQSEGAKNAAAAVIGSTAVGASFVGGTAAIGGAVVGSTLAGVAAFLALAAGGEAQENSLAAFNTYGEYNTLTFTVQPIRDYPDSEPYYKRETLLIGSDRNVIAKMNLWEGMEPHTVTIPIQGCHQLLFWLNNSGGNSATYLFSDVKVSKAPCTAYVPEDMRYSDPVVSLPAWHEYQITKAGIIKDFPKTTYGDPYYNFKEGLRIMYDHLKTLWNDVYPNYKVHTRHLRTDSGQLCKMVCLVTKENAPVNIDACANYWSKNLELSRTIQEEIVNCFIAGKKATVASIFAPAELKEAVKEGQAFLEECQQVLKNTMRCAKENQQFMNHLYRNALIVDGISSNQWFKIVPLDEGEEVSLPENEIGYLRYYQSDYKGRTLNDR